MSEPFDPVAFVRGLAVADVPTGLPLGGGTSVSDPAKMLSDLRYKLSCDGRLFFLGVERAVELRDALAAYDGTPAPLVHHLRKGEAPDAGTPS